MSEILEIDGIQYHPAPLAAKQLGYTKEYLLMLAKQGKIDGHKQANRWYINISSAEQFFKGATDERKDRRREISLERKCELQAHAEERAAHKRRKERISRRSVAIAETAAVLILGLMVGFSGYAGVQTGQRASVSSVPEFIDSFSLWLYRSIVPAHTSDVILTEIATTSVEHTVSVAMPEETAPLPPSLTASTASQTPAPQSIIIQGTGYAYNNDLAELISIVAGLTRIVGVSLTPPHDQTFIHKQADAIYDSLDDSVDNINDSIGDTNDDLSMLTADVDDIASDLASLSAFVATSSFAQGGNAFGHSALLGTTDNQPLSLITNGAERLTITADGKIGIGTTAPTQTLSVDGSGYVTGGLGIGVATTTSGVLQTASDAYIGGNLTVIGNSTVFGASSADSLVINSSIKSDLVPDQNITYDLGSPSFYWDNAYVGTLNANNIAAANTTISGTQNGSFVINSDNVTADTEDAVLNFFRGAVVPNALITWNSTLDRFEFNQPTYIENAAGSVASTTLTLKGVVGQIANILSVASSTGDEVFAVGPDGSITTSGKVGIGTTTPGKALTVVGAQDIFAANTHLRLVDTDVSGYSYIERNGTRTNFGNNNGTSSAVNMVINDSGNVGIGTTAPIERLDVVGNILSRSSASTGALYFGNSSHGIQRRPDGSTRDIEVFTDGTGSSFSVSTNGAGSKEFTILDSGNVGIGTTTPTARLDVTGAFNSLPARFLRHGTYGEIIRLGRNGVSESASIDYPTDGNLAFSTVGSERLRINSNGNVGIGTTSPIAQLHISTGGVASAVSSNADQLVLETPSVTGMTILSGASSEGSIFFGDSTSATIGRIIYNHAADDLSFWTGATKRLTIASNGNVGIGTTTPGALLDVWGAGTAGRGMRITETSTSKSNGVYAFTIDNTAQNTNVSASGAMAVDVNSGRAFTINGLGNVGIGTNAPGHKLSIVNTTNNNSLNISHTAPGFAAGVISTDQYGLLIDSASASASHYLLKLRGNGGTTEVLTALANGNVGIGTTSPASKLDVYGTASNGIHLASSGNDNGGYINSGGTSALYLSGGANYASGSYNFTAKTTTGAASGVIFESGKTQIWGNTGLTTGNTFAYSPRLTIDATGNVGIGTTSPASLLHLESNGADRILFSRSGLDSIAFRQPSFASNDAGRGLEFFNATDATSLLFLAQGGNIGINNTNPSIAKLSVVGSDANTSITTGAWNQELSNADTTANNWVRLGFNDGGGQAASAILGVQISDHTNNYGSFNFWTRGSTGSGTRMTIDSNGNIGIGSTIPTTRLTIVSPDVASSTLRLESRRVAILAGNILGGIDFASDDNNLITPGITTASILALANQTHSETALGTDLTFSTTNGTTMGERMRILGNGNIGIGATDPHALLDLRTADDGAFNRALRIGPDNTFIGGGSYLEFSASQVDGYGPQIGGIRTGGGTGDLIIRTGGNTQAERLRITDSGNIGIGTTNPTQLLEVSRAASGTVGAILNLVNPATTTIGNAVEMRFAPSSAFASRYASIQGINKDGSNNIDLAFLTGSGATINEKMRIMSGGNVGIGTTNPQTRLDIRADNTIAATSTLRIGTQTHGALGDEFGNLEFYWGDPDSPYVTSKIFARNTGNVGPGGGGAADLVFATAANSGAPVLNDRLVIKSSGTIGIGTTTPSSKLHVVGTNNVTGGLTIGSNTGTSADRLAIYGEGNSSAVIQSLVSGGTLAFRNGDNVEVMRLVGNNTLAIGTTTPAGNLHVYDATGNADILAERGGGARVAVSAQAAAGWIGTVTNHDLGLATNSSTRLTITAGGNVGIGTTTPGSALVVNGRVGVGGTASNALLEIAGNTSSRFIMARQTDAFGANISLIPGNGTNNSGIFANWGTGNGYLGLGAGTQNQMVINQSGYVGIGTTSPTRRLDVWDGSSSVVANLRSASGDNSFLSFSNNSSTADQVRIGSTAGNLVLSTNFAERMRIDSSGNVGIGTTSPTSKLTVAGDTDIAGALKFNGNSGTSGQILMSNGTGAPTWNATSSLGIVSSQWTTSGSDVYYNTGNVGIGTSTPNTLLHIVGTSNQFRVGYDSSDYVTLHVGNEGGTTLTTTGADPDLIFDTGNGDFSIANGNFFYSPTNHRLALNNSGADGLFSVYAPSNTQTNAVPIMTSNTEPSGEATASGGTAYKAFDGNTGSCDAACWYPSGFTSGWIAYEFPTSKVITKYVIYGSQSTTRNPTDWTFEAWDGEEWIVLDTRVDQSLTASANSYALTNTTAYTKYRLNITENQGGSPVQIKELQLMEAVSYSVPALQVASNGATGIGTTTPSAQLDVYGTAGSSDIFAISSSTNARLLTVTAVGNVGIGTSTPAATLHVEGTLVLNGTYPVGTGNIALGSLALASSSLSGGSNTAIGWSALTNNTSGSSNTALGYRALFTNSTGASNVGLGLDALRYNTSGSFNTVTGLAAMEQNTTGSNNTANGYLALRFNTTGTANVGIGYRAGYSTSDGSSNVSIGNDALYSNGSGSFNTAVGMAALNISVGAGSNTGLGYRAGSKITTGTQNIVIGYGGTTGITTGSNNIIIGQEVRAGLTVTGDNQLNIGNLIFGTGLASSTTYSTGNVGIGTNSPTTRLTIVSSSIASSTLRLESPRVAIVSGDILGGIDFASNDTTLTTPGTTTASILAVANTTHTASALGTDLAFSTTNGTITSEQMRITGSGNVGIGTTTPSALLDVAGQIKGGSASFGGANSDKVQVNSFGNFILNGSALFQGGTLLLSGTSFYNLTGIYNFGGTIRATGALSFQTNNVSTTTPLYINTAGNVGIGTTTPGALLTLSSSDPRVRLQDSDAGGEVWDIQAGVSGLFFVRDGTTDLALGQTGNTSIGTTTSLAKLTVDGSIALPNNNSLRIVDSGGNLVSVVNMTTANNIQYTGSAVSGSMQFTVPNNSGAFQFSTGATPSEKMRLTNTGFLGIGTTTPSAKLDVWGNLNVATGTVPTFFADTSIGRVGIGNAIPSATLDIAGTFKTSFDSTSEVGVVTGAGISTSRWSDTASTRAQIGLVRYRGTKLAPIAVQLGDAVGDFRWQAYDGSALIQPAQISATVDGTVATGSVPTGFSFLTGSNSGDRTERLTITSSGNIGIGTTTPSSKLSIAGDVALTGSLLFSGISGTGATLGVGSGPLESTLVSTYNTPGYAVGVTISGSYAYVADDSAGLQIIDISNPSSPTLVGTYDTPGSASGVTVSGQYAYVADYSAGLQIIDISNPSSPTLVGTYDTPGYAVGVTVSGQYAYVADYTYGLQIIDISNPSSPTLAGTYNTPGSAYSVTISGQYAYVADYSYDLQIIDISNPSSPTLAGTYNTPGSVQGVTISGQYAYVANDSAGLQIIDISNPSSPTLVGTYDTPGNAQGVTISGQYAYVADYTYGLQIIDISNPSSPTLAGTYNTPGSAFGVTISGQYAYVADYTYGLQIINFFTNSRLSVDTGLNVGSQGIYSLGNVGIGTTTPQRTLHVVNAADGAPVRFEDANGYCEIDPTSTTWTCTSDRRLKENIKSLDNAEILSKLAELRPVNFAWKSDATHVERTGLIAQEVEALFPDLVSTDSVTGYKSVAYGGFTTYLLSGVGQLAQERTQIAALLASGDATFATTSPFYDLMHTDSVWSRLVTLAQNFIDGILTVSGLHTDELCVGDVCVDEATFLKMVQENGGSSAPTIEEEDDASTTPPTSDDTGTTTDSEIGGGGTSTDPDAPEVTEEPAAEVTEDPAPPSEEQPEEPVIVSEEPEAPSTEAPEPSAPPAEEPDPEPSPEPAGDTSSDPV